MIDGRPQAEKYFFSPSFLPAESRKKSEKYTREIAYLSDDFQNAIDLNDF